MGTCFICPPVLMDGWMVVLRWAGEGWQAAREEDLAWITRIFVCDFNLGQFCHCRPAVQCSEWDDGQEKRREGRWTWSVGAAKVHINKLFPSRVVDLFPWHEASKQMNLWRKFRINDRNTAQNWYFFYSEKSGAYSTFNLLVIAMNVMKVSKLWLPIYHQVQYHSHSYLNVTYKTLDLTWLSDEMKCWS